MAEASKTETTGIGIFRTEGITVDGIPSFLAQVDIYRRTIKLMGEKEIYFRLFDFCADKIWFENADLYQVYATQLKALACAAAERPYLNVLVPNVNYTSQMTGVIRFAERMRAELEAERLPFGKLRFGAMIETPQATAVACEICALSDFAAVGLNGIARLPGDFPLFREEYNERALLRICKFIMCEAEKIGCRLTFCGDILTDRQMLVNLIGLGMRRISVAPKQAREAAHTISRSSYYSSVMTALDRSGKFITLDDVEEPSILESTC